MENSENQARLRAFMHWQLLPFSIVVFVYAVMENLWIYFQPGNQFVPPYFCLFIYNLILVLSLTGLCFKETKIFDLLNMTLTYFFLFATEIFNSVRVKETTNGVLNQRIDIGTGFFENLKCIKINQIVALVFFFYAVHVRAKCIEYVRVNSHMKPPVLNSIDLAFEIYPSKGKLSRTKIYWALFILLILVILKICVEVSVVVVNTKPLDTIMVLALIINNIYVVLLTISFYKSRSIKSNILCWFCSFTWFFQILLIGSLFRILLMQDPNILDQNLAIAYMVIACFMLGIPFVWANYTRLLLLEDCGYMASARRYFSESNFRQASVLPSNFDAEKQGARKMPANYEIIKN